LKAEALPPHSTCGGWSGQEDLYFAIPNRMSKLLKIRSEYITGTRSHGQTKEPRRPSAFSSDSGSNEAGSERPLRVRLGTKVQEVLSPPELDRHLHSERPAAETNAASLHAYL
jgi:hypothetical protein